jgi:hypothetical protein
VDNTQCSLTVATATSRRDRIRNQDCCRPRDRRDDRYSCRIAADRATHRSRSRGPAKDATALKRCARNAQSISPASRTSGWRWLMIFSRGCEVARHARTARSVATVRPHRSRIERSRCPGAERRQNSKLSSTIGSLERVHNLGVMARMLLNGEVGFSPYVMSMG